MHSPIIDQSVNPIPCWSWNFYQASYHSGIDLFRSGCLNLWSEYQWRIEEVSSSLLLGFCSDWLMWDCWCVDTEQRGPAFTVQSPTSQHQPQSDLWNNNLVDRFIGSNKPEWKWKHLQMKTNYSFLSSSPVWWRIWRKIFLLSLVFFLFSNSPPFHQENCISTNNIPDPGLAGKNNKMQRFSKQAISFILRYSRIRRTWSWSPSYKSCSGWFLLVRETVTEYWTISWVMTQTREKNNIYCWEYTSTDLLYWLGISSLHSVKITSDCYLLIQYISVYTQRASSS